MNRFNRLLGIQIAALIFCMGTLSFPCVAEGKTKRKKLKPNLIGGGYVVSGTRTSRVGNCFLIKDDFAVVSALQATVSRSRVQFASVTELTGTLKRNGRFSASNVINITPDGTSILSESLSGKFTYSKKTKKVTLVGKQTFTSVIAGQLDCTVEFDVLYSQL